MARHYPAPSLLPRTHHDCHEADALGVAQYGCEVDSYHTRETAAAARRCWCGRSHPDRCLCEPGKSGQHQSQQGGQSLWSARLSECAVGDEQAQEHDQVAYRYVRPLTKPIGGSS